jgi:hypothetical protein
MTRSAGGECPLESRLDHREAVRDGAIGSLSNPLRFAMLEQNPAASYVGRKASTRHGERLVIEECSSHPVEIRS